MSSSGVFGVWVAKVVGIDPLDYNLHNIAKVARETCMKGNVVVAAVFAGKTERAVVFTVLCDSGKRVRKTRSQEEEQRLRIPFVLPCVVDDSSGVDSRPD